MKIVRHSPLDSWVLTGQNLRSYQRLLVIVMCTHHVSMKYPIVSGTLELYLNVECFVPTLVNYIFTSLLVALFLLSKPSTFFLLPHLRQAIPSRNPAAHLDK